MCFDSGGAAVLPDVSSRGQNYIYFCGGGCFFYCLVDESLASRASERLNKPVGGCD